MPKNLVALAASLLALASPAVLANQLYLDGSIGSAEAEAGPYDADDTFIRIGAGVTLNETISAEAGFWDFGSARDGGVRISADALYGALKAGTDIGNGLHLYGRVGIMRWEAEAGRFDDDGFDLIFGGGINYQVGPGRLGVELHYGDMDEVDMRTIGVSYTLPIQI